MSTKQELIDNTVRSLSDALGEHGASMKIVSGDQAAPLGNARTVLLGNDEVQVTPDGEIVPRVTPDANNSTLSDDPYGRFYVPPDEHFSDIGFLESRPLEMLAAQLVANWRELGHLKQASIGVLWKQKGGKSGGKEVWGKANKTSGLVLHYSRHDFIIWLAADHCREGEITNGDLEALLYHELCHCDMEMDDNGNVKWAIRGHDVTAFYTELTRYGAWTPELRHMRKTYEQIALPPVSVTP